MKRLPDILLSLLAVLLLTAFALATPWPSITDEALEAHMEAASSVDDEYAFLFD